MWIGRDLVGLSVGPGKGRWVGRGMRAGDGGMEGVNEEERKRKEGGFGMRSSRNRRKDESVRFRDQIPWRINPSIPPHSPSLPCGRVVKGQASQSHIPTHPIKS
jgi:hypothetical protein